MKISIITIAVISLILVSCKDKTNEKKETIPQQNQVAKEDHTSENSLDWSGTYHGIIPCSDCEGIEQEMKLNEDNTFSIKESYLDKGKNSIHYNSGTFTWSEDGRIIVTVTEDKSSTVSYQVGEGKLIRLDSDNKKITGPLAEKYILKMGEVKK